jgi:predicted aspartyl protease
MYLRVLGAALSAAYLLVALPALADDLPTAAAIRAHVEAAKGPALASYRETIDEIRGGERYHTVSLHRGGDDRETIETGPARTSSGSYRGQRWRQNENGETILEGPESTAIDEITYTDSVERITDPVDGYLVASIDSAGNGTKQYVEASTWRVVRRDTIRATGTTITRYDDFRTIAGRTFASHVTIDDGTPENASDSRIDLEPGVIADSELAIPTTSQSFVEFPAGKSVVDLPVQEEGEKFFVRVTINGRGLDMALDSGAAGIVLEDDIVRQLGIAEFAASSNAANAGRVREARAIVPEMKIGDLSLRHVFVRTVPPFDKTRFMGTYRAVGLLGFDFIYALALKLDYYDGTVTAYAPGTFAPPPTQEGQFNIDIRLASGVPLTNVTVNGALGDRFVVDTGAAASMVIFQKFARRNPSALVGEPGADVPSEQRMRGVGGDFVTKPIQLAKITFGPVNFTDFVALLVTQRGAYDSADDGVVGAQFLHIFDVTFDYAHGKAYFAFHG